MAQSDSSASFWENLRAGFMRIRQDCAIDPPLKPAGALTAIWSAISAPECWSLNLAFGTDGAGVKKRFEWHAQSASARLGCSDVGYGALAFWLDRVARDAPDPYRGINSEAKREVYDICGLSAEYCRKCEADEFIAGNLKAEAEKDTTYPLVHQYELYKGIKNLVEGPHEEVPEAVLRSLLSKQYAIDSNDVNNEQIRRGGYELSSRYGAVSIIPPAPAGETKVRENVDPTPTDARESHPNDISSAVRGEGKAPGDPKIERRPSARMAEVPLAPGNAQQRTRRPNRLYGPSFKRIADGKFDKSRERIMSNYREKLSALGGTVSAKNSGAYLPARIKLEVVTRQKIVRARADALVKTARLFKIPLSMSADGAFRIFAQQAAAGSIAGVRGDLKLRSVRLRRPEEGQGIPWHLEIERAIDRALNDGLLSFEEQRIIAAGMADSGQVITGNPNQKRAPISSSPTPKVYKTKIGENIGRFRKECGWSFDVLADKTGIDKKLILGHINDGKGAQVRTLKTYADAFTKELRRPITVADLEG